MKRPWLPEELKPYSIARKALGVVLDRPMDNPEDSMAYRMLYREKVVDLVRKSPEHLEDVKTYLGEKVVLFLSDKASPEEVAENMWGTSGEWKGPYTQMSLFLQKRAEIDDVYDALRLWGEDKEPVSDKEFLIELAELSLAEFLELVTSSD